MTRQVLSHPLPDLVLRDSLLPTPFLIHSPPLPRNHEGSDALPKLLIRNAHHSGFLHPVHLEQTILHLQRVNVLPRADDEILDPPRDLDVPSPSMHASSPEYIHTLPSSSSRLTSFVFSSSPQYPFITSGSTILTAVCGIARPTLPVRFSNASSGAVMQLTGLVSVIP
ncbi:hypothetical protein Ct61P_14355 [Colletotrichum tofieldiae]|nr:hypothetical protein Ct61P_14355 [Colletotrichum tofieldiae]